MQQEKQGSIPFFLFHLSGDTRNHSHFYFKGCSIFSFPLTESVDSDKVLKKRDRHTDCTGKKIYTYCLEFYSTKVWREKKKKRQSTSVGLVISSF